MDIWCSWFSWWSRSQRWSSLPWSWWFSCQVTIDVLRQASKACVVKREFSKVSIWWWFSLWSWFQWSTMIIVTIIVDNVQSKHLMVVFMMIMISMIISWLLWRRLLRMMSFSNYFQAEVLVKQSVCLAKGIYGTNHAK